jgi:hypothetical protein
MKLRGHAPNRLVPSVLLRCLLDHVTHAEHGSVGHTKLKLDVRERRLFIAVISPAFGSLIAAYVSRAQPRAQRYPQALQRCAYGHAELPPALFAVIQPSAVAMLFAPRRSSRSLFSSSGVHGGVGVAIIFPSPFNPSLTRRRISH